VLEPEVPDLMYNLTVAFRQQGRSEESKTRLRDLVTRHPDYIFASAAWAKLLLEKGEGEAAEAILKPFLSRERFHILEFSAFMDAYIEVMLAKKGEKIARSWLEMWSRVNSQVQYKDPQLDYWRKRLGRSLKLSQPFG